MSRASLGSVFRKRYRDRHGKLRVTNNWFDDPLSMTFPDTDHSVGEQRYVILGISARNRVLVVAHRDNGEVVRIISARAATWRERRFYEENATSPD